MFSDLKKEIASTTDTSLASKTERRLAELLFLNSEMTLYAFMAIAVAFWWLFTRSVPYLWPTTWTLSVCVLQLIRVGHIRHFLKLSEESRDDCKSHIRLFWCLGSLSALLWSAALLFFFNPVNESFFVVYAFVTAGIACVAITSLAYVPKTYPIIITLFLLPLSSFFFSRGGMENLFLGTTALVFIGFGTALSRRLRGKRGAFDFPGNHQPGVG